MKGVAPESAEQVMALLDRSTTNRTRFTFATADPADFHVTAWEEDHTGPRFKAHNTAAITIGNKATWPHRC